MKRLLYIVVSMILIMFFATGAMAQQLTGESETFVFDTRVGTVIPLSNSILIIFFILAAGSILLRHYLQKRKTVA